MAEPCTVVHAQDARLALGAVGVLGVEFNVVGVDVVAALQVVDDL